MSVTGLHTASSALVGMNQQSNQADGTGMVVDAWSWRNVCTRAGACKRNCINSWIVLPSRMMTVLTTSLLRLGGSWWMGEISFSLQRWCTLPCHASHSAQYHVVLYIARLYYREVCLIFLALECVVSNIVACMSLLICTYIVCIYLFSSFFQILYAPLLFPEVLLFCAYQC